VQVQARDDFVATAAYQPEPAAAAAARRFVRETLRSWPLPGRTARQDTVIDDAVLLTSELVTNAVVHAGTSVQVTCRLSDGAVEIVVLDGRPAQLIPDRPNGPAEPAERTSGRGLQLPSELASAWGVTYAQAAKAVWFRISLPGFGAGATAHTRGAAALADSAGRAGMLDRASATADRTAASARMSAVADRTPVAADRTPVVADRTRAAADSIPAWARRNLTRLGYEELLSSTAEAVRAAVVADIAYLLNVGEDGELRVRAVAGTGPSRLVDGSAQEAAARALADAALSLVTVPLVVDRRVTGVLVVAAAEADRFGEQDAARLQDLADWSAPALERARLAGLEHGRQDRAEFLAEAGEQLSVSLGEAEIGAVGARLAVRHLARWCAVLVTAENRPPRLVHAAHADAARIGDLEWLLDRVGPPPGPAPGRPVHGRPAGWRWRLELPAGPGGTPEPGARTHALRLQGGRAGRRDRLDRPEGMPPGAAELAADDVWCFPLDAADQTLGLLAIGGAGEQWPPGEARELAAGLARRIAVALDSSGRSAPRRVSAVGRAPVAQPPVRQEQPDQPPSDQRRSDQPQSDQPQSDRPQSDRPQSDQRQHRQLQDDHVRVGQAQGRQVRTGQAQDHLPQGYQIRTGPA
jgi:anti-sigma regulatory factor (Ser/Thr protein kinase)